MSDDDYDATVETTDFEVDCDATVDTTDSNNNDE